MAGKPQIHGKVTATENSKFKRYADSLGLTKTALAQLLLERELHRKALDQAKIKPETPNGFKITAHVRSPELKPAFDVYAASLGFPSGTVAAAIFRLELEERWLEREVRGGGKVVDSN